MTLFRTARLELVATTLDHLHAELDGDLPRLGSMLNARIPKSWPPGEYDRDALEYFRSRLEADPDAAGWYGWYVIQRGETSDGELIAGAGFLGPPDDDGTVEIGYSVVEEARGAGYATEIVGALVRRAFESKAVTRIVARTAPANAASIGVLERNGFRRTEGGDTDTLLFETIRTEATT